MFRTTTLHFKGSHQRSEARGIDYSDTLFFLSNGKRSGSMESSCEHVNEDAEPVCRDMENIILSKMNIVHDAAQSGLEKRRFLFMYVLIRS
jgi:hypothetical protein